MKAATLPAVCVPPELRQATEELLATGETLPGFVARGLASRDVARTSGRYVNAMTVVDKIGRRLAMAQKKAAIAK